ncbi:MAG: hypothetical protein COA73_03625 [Candidatus Hydrogenedentota bacterium]|nr:MAG: hypothetical protein COA73_03625 [Candidatus Hydrogenedentota bacterium]
MDTLTRRTFIASSSLTAVGLLLPTRLAAAATPGVWDALKNLYDQGELGAVRRCHLQCLRADAPSMRDAIEGLQQALGLTTPQKISACGKYVVPNQQPAHFLVNLEYDPGPTLILTSTSMPGSWGMIRGENGNAELFSDKIVLHRKQGEVEEYPVTIESLPRTQTSLTVLNLSLDALNQAVTIYPDK